jgi:hypothetical protein
MWAVVVRLILVTVPRSNTRFAAPLYTMLPFAEAGREIACLVHVVPSQVQVSGGTGGGPSIPAG